MESFIVFVMAIALASALGSGPYLPSGWKPKGPAFLLPAEIEKTSETPQSQEMPESEASGSDFLQEYGPPEILNIYQAVTKQELPDFFTERTFTISENQNSENAGVVRSNVFQTLDDKIDPVNAIDAIEEGLEVTEKIEDVLIGEDESTAEPASDETPEINVRINTKSDSVKDVSTNFNETAEDDNVSVVAPTELTKINEVAVELNPSTEAGEPASLSPVAVGEADGFREYGPPRSTAQSQDKYESERIKANEVRKRRFSSKFGIAHKH